MPRLSRRKTLASLLILSATILLLRLQVSMKQKVESAITANEAKRNNSFDTEDKKASRNNKQPTASKAVEKYTIPSDYDPSFAHPGWACSSPSRSTDKSAKLIFVHVFKTAGSTFRTFFHDYGKKCGKGVSIIILDVEVNSGTLH